MLEYPWTVRLDPERRSFSTRKATIERSQPMRSSRGKAMAVLRMVPPLVDTMFARVGGKSTAIRMPTAVEAFFWLIWFWTATAFVSMVNPA